MPGRRPAGKGLTMTLHGYWRSTTSYRVRIALGLKGVAYVQATHDLRVGAQRLESFRAVNPQGLVPALDTPDGILTQSPAIIEWLEERYPTPALLPDDPAGRAAVRAMAAVIGCDIHPINNLRVLDTLRREFGATKQQVDAWATRWITEGFQALEAMLSKHAGAYAHGDTPSIADCYLLPQVYSAERFRVDLKPFPLVTAIAGAFARLPPVAAAHPDRQPDADRQ
jgi:maleylpyruvate isomerase